MCPGELYGVLISNPLSELGYVNPFFVGYNSIDHIHMFLEHFLTDGGRLKWVSGMPSSMVERNNIISSSMVVDVRTHS